MYRYIVMVKCFYEFNCQTLILMNIINYQNHLELFYAGEYSWSVWTYVNHLTLNTVHATSS